MNTYSYLGNADPSAIEGLYEQFLTNPSAMEEGWRNFFEGFEFSRTDVKSNGNVVPENVRKNDGSDTRVHPLLGYLRRCLPCILPYALHRHRGFPKKVLLLDKL